ncbi:hypothetical protein [Prescottella equi]|uniref:hypothetical protein n=1 Tax=Rhodococcus hoagii TaxID=43767 RepID=UPI000A113AD0|nr:hypothetical protein [Prescottella equi]ORL98829.1 hypothetical protein A5N72_22360 [Prescottella equi]
MSFWAWLADVANGPVGGAVVALGGVALTQRSSRADKRRDREVAVEDKLREEVAGLLVLKVKTSDLQRDIGNRIREAREVGTIEGPVFDAAFGALHVARHAYAEHLEDVRDRATRISFLTREPRLTAALTALRALTYGDSSLPVFALNGDPTSTGEKLQVLRAATDRAFDEVEEATRALVVNHGGVDPSGGSVIRFRRPRKPRDARPDVIDEQAG